MGDAVFHQTTTRIGRGGWEAMYDPDWYRRLHIRTIFGIVFGRASAQYGSQRDTLAAQDQRLTAAEGQACESKKFEFPRV